MRTIPFTDLLHRAAQRSGDSPARLQEETASALADYATQNSEFCWKFHDWPETWLVEERAVSSAGIVAYEQSGRRAISEVLGVYDKDPLTDDLSRSLRYTLGPAGIFLQGTARTSFSTVWVKLRQQSPRYTSTAYDAAVNYGIDTVVLYNNRCWRARYSAPAGDTPGLHYWHMALPLTGVNATTGVATAAGGITLADDGTGWSTGANIASILTTKLGLSVVFTPEAGLYAAHFRIYSDAAADYAALQNVHGDLVISFTFDGVDYTPDALPVTPRTWEEQPVLEILAQSLVYCMQADLQEEADQFDKAGALRARATGLLETQVVSLMRTQKQALRYR